MVLEEGETYSFETFFGTIGRGLGRDVVGDIQSGQTADGHHVELQSSGTLLRDAWRGTVTCFGDD